MDKIEGCLSAVYIFPDEWQIEANFLAFVEFLYASHLLVCNWSNILL